MSAIDPELSVIAALIEAGADPDARAHDGSAPLHWAAGRGSRHWEFKPDVDFHGGYYGPFPQLISGVPELIRAFDGYGPEGVGMGQRREREKLEPSVIAALIKAGADPGVRDGNGWTPLHWAATWAAKEGPELSAIAALIEAGADPGARAGDCSTPLHWAARRSPALSVLAALIEAGADPSARDEDGSTPLHWAARYNPEPSVIAVLVEAGADPGARDEDGFMPLHWAAGYNLESSVIAALIEAGADPDARDEGGFTPLHLAAGYNDDRWKARDDRHWPRDGRHWQRRNPEPSVIAALIEGGADPAARDEDGKFPFDYAKGNWALRRTDVYWRLSEARFG